MEEIEVETEVLSKADELGMTSAERVDLQNPINGYRKELWDDYHRTAP
jgi:hypothetical protein